MPASIVQSASTIGTTASADVVLGAAPAVGNTLVAIMAADAYQTAVPTAGVGRPYVQQVLSENNLGFYVWTREAASGDSATTTFTLGAASSACVVLEILGAYDKAGAVTTTNNAGFNTQVTAGLSPATTDGLVLAIAGLTSTANVLSDISADNGFNAAINAVNPASGAGQANVLVASKVTTTTDPTGTTTFTWTANASDRSGVQVAFTGVAGDTTPPTAPSSLSAASPTSTGGALSWTQGTDAVGVTQNRIYVDGVVHATIPAATSSVVDGLTPSTTYSVTVTALDAAGNESPPSVAQPLTTLDPPAPPVATLYAYEWDGSGWVPLGTAVVHTHDGDGWVELVIT